MNPYEQLGREPLGRVEVVNLLDVAHAQVERAYGYVEKALEGMKDGSEGIAYIEHAIQGLSDVKGWLEEAMREMEG